MPINIKQIPQETLSEYPRISPVFTVSSILQCKPVYGGLGGILLEEQPVADPFVKDTYDVDPEQWKAQFDPSGWGFFIAYEDDIPVGCAGVATHFGQTISGSRSTSDRINSKERLPEPMMIEARNSITCTPEARSTSPVSCRLRK